MFGIARNNKNKIERNKKIKPGKCIFPFTYKWQQHNECFPTKKGDICATEIKLPRRTLRRYGYCKKKRTKKKTLKKLKTRQNPKSKTIKNLKKRLTIKKIDRKLTLKKRNINITKDNSNMYNQKFISVLDNLEKLMKQKGEHFRARAYAKAKESIMLIEEPITSVDQLKGRKGIGKTILAKMKEFKDTGTLKVLEKAKNDPVLMFTDVYGIGPKKAQELVKKHNVTTIVELRDRQDELLNDVQKKGLKYYEDVLKRIPRAEIDKYNKILQREFNKVKNSNSSIQIVGSYRRGAIDSGDIDIIISDPDNDEQIFVKFIDALIKKNLLIEVLSRGNVKSLGVSRLTKRSKARRIDFMFSPKKEFAFALLYFTGSKAFNTVMRRRALDLGYSMNEHGFHNMVDGKKTTKLTRYFPTEKSVFDFLGMEFRGPTERQDGNAVVIKTKQANKKSEKKAPKKKTLKKKKKEPTTRQLIKAFVTEGQPVLENLRETQLSAMIRLANKLYYCNSKAIMEDDEYDILKEFIEEKFPENAAIKEGHTMCSVAVEKKKMTLPFEMWSMDKFKKEQQITTWLKQYKGPFVISAKVDGVSAGYSTMGDKPTLFTRGNGKVGQDISHAIPYLNLPIKKGIEIRGELLMKKEVFEKNWSDKFANVRNMIAGTANAKESFPERWNDIDFVAYEVITPELTPSQQFQFLKKHNTITVINKRFKKFSKNTLSRYLVDWRENYEYDIDGIIVADNHTYPRTSKNPKHAFAFKMVLGDQVVESKVVNVIWSPSKDGYLKPKVQVQPVTLGGAVIQYATLHNAEFVIKNKIGIGATVQIIRSGDVIPKVEKVTKPAKHIKMPSTEFKYKWNKTRKDFVLENASKNEIVVLKLIEAFFVKLDVKGLGRGNIKRIMNAGFDTIPKILVMTVDDFLSVEGFKEKMANKVHGAIQDMLNRVKLEDLMGASNIFGRGLGTKRIKIIMENYPDILTSNKTSNKKIEMISQLDGFKEKTAEMFVPYIPEFMQFIKTIQLESKLQQTKKTQYDKSHPLYQKKLVITGFRDKEFQKKLEALGAKFGSSVSKKTFAVIVSSLDDDTGKADKARSLNVPLVTKQQFNEQYLN